MVTAIDLAAALRRPIVAANGLICITCAIWLAKLDGHRFILIGFLGLLGGVFAIAMALMPVLFLFVIPQAQRARRNQSADVLLLFASSVCRFIAYSIWCLGVLWYFSSAASQELIIPLFGWSCVVGNGSIIITAFVCKDRDLANLMIFFPFLAYMCTGLWWLFGARTISSAIVIFSAIMLSGALTSLVIQRQKLDASR